MDLLQKYVFIPLDIFKNNLHNKGIQNKLDAWLAFLSCDAPEDIVNIITAYPEFIDLYEHIYDICLNIEKVMKMFSKELRELDRNTVRYMIDDMQKQYEYLKEEHNQLQDANDHLQNANDQLQNANDQLQNANDQLQKDNNYLRSELRDLKEQFQKNDIKLSQITVLYEETLKKIEELTRK